MTAEEIYPLIDEDDQTETQSPTTDFPVLYPEVAEDDEDATELASEAAAAAGAAAEDIQPDEPVPGEIADLVREETDEELVISKWPDPAESGGRGS